MEKEMLIKAECLLIATRFIENLAILSETKESRNSYYYKRRLLKAKIALDLSKVIEGFEKGYLDIYEKINYSKFPEFGIYSNFSSEIKDRISLIIEEYECATQIYDSHFSKTLIEIIFDSYLDFDMFKNSAIKSNAATEEKNKINDILIAKGFEQAKLYKSGILNETGLLAVLNDVNNKLNEIHKKGYGRQEEVALMLELLECNSLYKLEDDISRQTVLINMALFFFEAVRRYDSEISNYIIDNSLIPLNLAIISETGNKSMVAHLFEINQSVIAEKILYNEKYDAYDNNLTNKHNDIDILKAILNTCDVDNDLLIRLITSGKLIMTPQIIDTITNHYKPIFDDKYNTYTTKHNEEMLRYNRCDT